MTLGVVKGWLRFGTIIIVGGGAIEMGDWLLKRFQGKPFLPSAPKANRQLYLSQRGDDLTPILAIALGLYRQAIR